MNNRKANSRRIFLAAIASFIAGVIGVAQVVPTWAGFGSSSLTNGENTAQPSYFDSLDTQIEDFYDPSVVYQVPETVGDDEEISVIVKLNRDSIFDRYEQSGYKGSIGEYSVTTEGKNISKNISNESNALRYKIEQAGVQFVDGNEYDVLFGGFEVVIKASQFEALTRAVEGSATTIISEVYEKCETQLVTNDVNVYDTGIFNSSESEYQGDGVVVAVLDTGLDYTHTAFSIDSFESSNPRMDLEFISERIGNTRAAQLTKGLNADDVYLNARVPFSYDYADKDADVYPISSEHGTHVSGIIVGKDETITGVAPHAQLVSMKVFSDIQNGAKQSWILAAVEDCVTLGVDVVNMSLGSACGFTREQDDKNTYEIYENVRKAGISLIVSASNSYNATFGSEKNGNLGLTSNPDSGTVGSPSTYEASLSVASISGVKTPYLLFNGEIMYFNEGSNASSEPKDFVDDILANGGAEGDFEYVTIPGIGRSGDYSGIDVTGKIALVKRGSNTFEEKARIAQKQGAIGVIIYNNVSGDISMNVGTITIAACSISQDDGEKLAAQATGKIRITRDQVAGPFMSAFSSWGPTSDLRIKPEITAHGGDILSAVPGQDYDRLSGTSMAAPNQAGVTALIRQYVKERFPEIKDNPIAVAARVNQIMMSTTDIAINTNGLPYAVRKQGAGLANLQKATSSPAYLTTFDSEGEVMDKTKLELGDDPDKTGVYTMTFAINNIIDKSLSFDVNTIVQTEGVSETKTHQGDTTVTEKGYALSPSSVSVSVEGGSASGNTVTVNANSSAKVTVVVNLSDADKKYLDESFENGMYIEGFVQVKAKDSEACDLSVPYLAFYGDWTQAPIFDLDYFVTNKDELDDSIDTLDKTMADAYATRPVGGLNGDYIAYLGSYYFIQDPSATKISADRKYIALSNQEDAVNNIYAIFAGLLRNVKRAELIVTEELTGKVIYTYEEENIRKSWNRGGAIYYSTIRPEFAVKDFDLKNNTKYNVTVKTYIDYGEGENEGGATNNLNNTFEFPFVTDFEAPAVTNSRFYAEYDRNEKKNKIYLELSIYDNHYAMAAQIGNIRLNDKYIEGSVDDETRSKYMLTSFNRYITPINSSYNSTSIVTYEITDYIDLIKNTSYNKDSVIVMVYDYASNSAYYEVNVPDEIQGVYFEEESITLNPNEVYALNPKSYPDNTLPEMLTYSSSDENVIRIVNGKIIAVASGSAVVTAKSPIEGVSAELPVTVRGENDEGYIKYDKPTADIFRLTGYKTEKAFHFLSSSDRDIGVTGQLVHTKGDTFALSMYPSEEVTVQYEFDAYFPDETKVKFISGNESIATVDENGKITAVAEGYGQVEVKVVIIDEEGNEIGATYESQTIQITVKNPYARSGPMLTGYYGNGGTVVIPEDLGFTTINQYAFSNYEYVPKDENDEISDEDPYKSKIWYIGEDTITKVVVPEGVETIGAYAFANLTALEEVQLPSTLKMISQGAFEKCTSLKKITKTGAGEQSPNNGLQSVKFINKDAFKDCSLDDVEFGEIIAIGNSAFENNILLSLTLPAKAQSLGARSFANNPELKSVTITADKVKLGTECFADCTDFDTISINAAVIPQGAFSGCTSLKNVTIGKDVAVIDAKAFAGTKVSKFTIDANNNTFSTNSNGSAILNKAGDQLISVAPNLTSFTGESTIKSVGKGAFAGNQNITTVTLTGVTKVGDNAFDGCTKLYKLTLGNLTEIGKYAFRQTSLNATPSLEHVSVLGDYAFAGSALVSVTIPDGMKIGSHAFADCRSLKYVTIGNDVEVGEYAFFTTVQVGESFTIEYSKLTSLTIGTGAVISDYAFHGSSKVVTVELGAGAEIGNYAFYFANSLETIDLSKVISIGDYAFSAAPLQRKGADGTTESVYWSPKLTTVDLSSVERLGIRSFAFCTEITSVILSENITEIPDYAFSYCESLQTFDFANIVKVGEGAFYNANLTSADLSSVTEIGDGAFMGNANLQSVVLNANGSVLGAGVFNNAENLATVQNLDKVTSIGARAFYKTAITSANLESATSIGDFAFEDSKITSVTLGNVLVAIGENPFAKCAIPAFVGKDSDDFNNNKFEFETDTYEISEQVKVIGGVLYRVEGDGLVLITYPTAKKEGSYTVADGTIRLSAFAFANSPIRNVVLPRSLKAIGDKAFFGCNDLGVVTFMSIDAPILEEQYDLVYVFGDKDNLPLPFTGSMEIYDDEPEYEGLGIVPFYMWNIFSTYSNFYYGANFVNYIGRVDKSLVMVCPNNGKNYDSFIYGKYFDTVVKGMTVATDATLAVIEKIDNLPENIDLTHEQLVNETRAAYNALTVEQQALVGNINVLSSAENTIEYIKKLNSSESSSEGSGESADIQPGKGGANGLIGALIGVVATIVVLAAAAFVLVKLGVLKVNVSGQKAPKVVDDEPKQTDQEDIEEKADEVAVQDEQTVTQEETVQAAEAEQTDEEQQTDKE